MLGLVGAERWLRESLAAVVMIFLLQNPGMAMDVTIAWEANTEANLAGYWV